MRLQSGLRKWQCQLTFSFFTAIIPRTLVAGLDIAKIKRIMKPI